jgi:hypothetical protein
VRCDHASVGKQFAGVLEADDTVAEEAPALLREGGDDAGRVTVHGVGGGAGRLVLAHGVASLCWAAVPHVTVVAIDTPVVELVT